MTLRRHLAVPAGLALLLVAGGAPVLSGTAAAVPAGVAAAQAFPSPGSRSVSPQSQISFRGVSDVAGLTVTGSTTGAHPGRLLRHSDRDGVSFVPARPFAPGETVTVRSAVAVAGSAAGEFRYRVARPSAAPPTAPEVQAPAASAAVEPGPYRSRPDLRPPRVTTGTAGPHAPGLLFASSGTPTAGADTGVLIYDDGGEPVWFNPLPPTSLGTLQRITYRGQDALTWFTGTQAFAGGFKGSWIVANTGYQQIGQVSAANGLVADGHELRISPDGTKALLDIYNPLQLDMSAYGGARDTTVYEAVVQEIDLGTGAVTFEWHSLDESPLTDSYVALNAQNIDYFHLNSMDYDTDGGILLSGRHVSQALKLDRNAPTGSRVRWRLGGKRSSYAFPRASDAPSFPHDVRRRPDGTIGLYDNAVLTDHNGRGLAYRLDDVAHTAAAVRSWPHDPPVYGPFVGSSRLLDNGDQLVSYGTSGYTAEYAPGGAKVWESKFGTDAWTYRTLRVDGWHALPAEAPALATTRSGTTLTGYASWNGATEVASWVLLAGPDVGHLRQVGGISPRLGFETTLSGTVTSQDTVFVAEARTANGGFLRRSSGSDTSTPIQAHYNSLGGPGGLLGAPTSGETAVPGGAYTTYQHGVIYYSAATGAWEVHGDILGTWTSLGAQASVLGFPTTDERATSDGVGRFSLFAKGTIYWTPSIGAHEVHGLIGAKWSGLGSQTSLLGYPLTNELVTPDGAGRYNHFQGGSVYNSPSGTFEVHGAIRELWTATGWERGVLGYPTSDETAVADRVGRVSRFVQGAAHWSPATGAHEVYGSIGSRYTSLGEEAGVLGYPLTGETGTPDGIGRYNIFERGSIYYSPGSGTYEVHGAIREKWASTGYENGVLGYPVSDEFDVPGGRRSNFQHGALVWDAASGIVTPVP